MWTCPACQSALNLADNVWRCENSHSFDRAKEGYVNLLLAQHKRSKTPGDSKAMIVARRAFLNAGHYQPLADTLASLLNQHSVVLQETKPSKDVDTHAVHLFDAGCGEGYYLNHVMTTLADTGYSIQASGIDIAKIAVQKAAKSYQSAQFAVASTFQLPLSDNSQHVVIQVFAPADVQEIHRVLAPGGVWLKVDPAPDHLQTLKAAVYDKPQQHEIDEQVPSGFTLAERQQLNFPVTLIDPDSRANLLKMTPFYWRATEQKQAEILHQLPQVEASFDIKVMLREAG